MPILGKFTDTISRLAGPKKQPAIPLPNSSGGVGVHYGGEDLILSKPFIVATSLQIFFCFIAMACFAAVAAFQAKWGVGPSGLSAFAIFISIATMFGSAFLVTVPVIYDKYDKLHSLARALREVRVGFITNGFGVVVMLLAAFVTTISAWTQPGCKDPNTDPSASKIKDKVFVQSLPDWCRTKKSGAMFFWFALIAWLVTLFLTFQEWRSGKKIYRPQDPPFTRPMESMAHEDDDDNPYTPRPGAGGHRQEDTYDQPTSPFTDKNRYTGGAGRPSMDAYGAFNDPTPSGYGDQQRVSRTMQYADPYAAVRASINPNADGSAPPPPQTYDNGYQGYRS